MPKPLAPPSIGDFYLTLRTFHRAFLGLIFKGKERNNGATSGPQGRGNFGARWKSHGSLSWWSGIGFPEKSVAIF